MKVREFMNLREVADYLGCGRSQSYKIIRPGPRALPAYRCGRKVLVKRSDLENWLEEHRYKPEPSTGSHGFENTAADAAGAGTREDPF